MKFFNLELDSKKKIYWISNSIIKSVILSKGSSLNIFYIIFNASYISSRSTSLLNSQYIEFSHYLRITSIM